MVSWIIKAQCWTRQGRPSTWCGVVEAEDIAGALAAADKKLSRLHHRYTMTARRAVEAEEI